MRKYLLACCLFCSGSSFAANGEMCPSGPKLEAISCKNQVPKGKLISGLAAALPGILCKSGSFFRTCFTTTEKECIGRMVALTDLCIEAMKNDIPETMTGKEPGIWGAKVGSCAGSSFEIALKGENKFISSKECNDPSKWAGKN